MKGPKKSGDNLKSNNQKQNESEVKIKYDIHTPDDRDPQPKTYDEIEY